MNPDKTTLLFAKTLHHGAGSLQTGDLVVPPIVPASVYYLPGEPSGPHQYGRWSNPTWSALEEALSELEAAETVIFPSGMAAIASVLYSQLRPRDRVLLPSDGYYTTRAFAEQFLSPFGIIVDLCPTAEVDQRSLKGYRLVWVETPSNPGLDLCNIESVTSMAKEAGVIVVVDNTTSTPLGQRPLDFGAHAIVSSDTKTVSGHSDALMGHVSSRDAALIARIRDWRKLAGAIPGPFEAWLVHRGLETLDVRYSRMCANAGILAQRLSEHRAIEAVRYPGLANHPAHDTAKRQMLHFGGLIGVTFASKDTADRFIGETNFIRAATSFGGVQTSAERRARWGDQVPDGFIRLSVGCEPIEVLWDDMRRVLDNL